tara:strand:- start:1350 stop:1595 length:246 start_codon:yes stop_codon:yes gene_type:complete
VRVFKRERGFGLAAVDCSFVVGMHVYWLAVQPEQECTQTGNDCPGGRGMVREPGKRGKLAGLAGHGSRGGGWQQGEVRRND